MSRLFEENFENYGSNAAQLTQGVWASSAFATLTIPSFELDGRYWYEATGNAAHESRVALAGASTGVGIFMQLHVPALPETLTSMAPIEFADAGNVLVARVYVTPTGELSVRNASNTQVGITTSQPIKPGTTHKIQMQMVFNGGAGTCEIRVDNVVVLNLTGLSLAGTASIFRLGRAAQFFRYLVKSIAIYSLTGTYNSDWPNIDGVVTLYPNADTVDAGWTPRPRQLFGAGNMFFDNTGDVLDCGTADFNLGSGDYTLEGWVRFVQRPTAANIADLWSKWSASTSQRSYRLALYGPDLEGGGLVFERTTDGTLATRTVIHDVNWQPNIGHWYHIAVTRESGVNRLFIDGVKQGVDVADSATYHNASTNAKFCVGGEISGTGSSVLSNTSLNGSVDEIRMTPGVARYTANFTRPSAPFPRSAPSDPDFASVALLCGFDEAVVDESAVPRTLTARGNAARQEWLDGGAEYLTLNPAVSVDDRFLEGALLSASGVLTLTAVPLNGETVTLGAKTYTFVTTIGAANTVLIGVDVAACLSNLAAAINLGAGIGTLYGTGTTINLQASAEINKPTTSDLTATALTPGTAGNSIASTETLTTGSWSASTLLGGVNLPADSAFTLQPLPRFVTGVRWISVRNRSYLSQGAGKLQVGFDVNGVKDLGADRALTTAVTYAADAFEEDPSTNSALTPLSITNTKIFLDRTE